jgi:hypothetical protein
MFLHLQNRIQISHKGELSDLQPFVGNQRMLRVGGKLIFAVLMLSQQTSDYSSMKTPFNKADFHG